MSVSKEVVQEVMQLVNPCQDELPSVDTREDDEEEEMEPEMLETFDPVDIVDLPGGYVRTQKRRLHNAMGDAKKGIIWKTDKHLTECMEMEFASLIER